MYKLFLVHAVDCLLPVEVSALKYYAWSVGGNLWVASPKRVRILILKVPVWVDALPISPDYYYQIKDKNLFMDIMTLGWK